MGGVRSLPGLNLVVAGMRADGDWATQREWGSRESLTDRGAARLSRGRNTEYGGRRKVADMTSERGAGSPSADPSRPVIDHGTAPLQWPLAAYSRPAEESTPANSPAGQPTSEAPLEPLPIQEFLGEPALLVTDFVPAPLPSTRRGQPLEKPPVRSGQVPGPVPGPAGDALPAATSQAQVPRRSLIRRAIGGVGWSITTLFGLACVLLLLAVVSAIPVVNFLALGYLLEAEGHVARTGRFRDGFPLLRFAPRLGSIVLGVWLWLLPLRVLGDVAADARLVAPGSPPDLFVQGLRLVAVAGVTVHLLLALARGGTLGCFFRPLKNLRWLRQQWNREEYWQGIEQAIAEHLAALHLRRRFGLGLKGFFGALAWLFVPTLLLASATRSEGPPVLLALLGGLLLVPVLMWVPFLQAHFACEQRWGAMFELREVRQLYRHSPLAWAVALLVTLGFALPLYLFKVALPPRDALWFITLLYVLSIYPARLVAGWAYHRACQRPRKAAWLWRWTCWLPTLPVVLLYVFLLYFTQFIGKYGKLTLFEHHAFLVPSPYSFFN